MRICQELLIIVHPVPPFMNVFCRLWTLLLVALFCRPTATAQPVAKFTFNNGSQRDEIGGQDAKLVGSTFVEDRFGNEKHAVLFFGNESSYGNLGTYAALKPPKGTISLWAMIERDSWTGTGPDYNPIILTKQTKLNDFYEAYAMYYVPTSHRGIVVTAEDSTRDLAIVSQAPISIQRWHHWVITFDDESQAFYLDGQLQQKVRKNFPTRYVEGDSVLLAATGNTKNKRWMLGAIDDIEIYDRPLNAEEVNQLYHAPNPNRRQIILNWVIGSIIALVLLGCIALFIRRRIKKGIEKEKRAHEQERKLLETEIRVHRASMNPHFIFNSMNALLGFILKKDFDKSSSYLIKFSKLLRMTLESNNHDLVTLDFEIDLLNRYLELENLRFRENILCPLDVDPNLVVSTIQIPVMMLQPFVENAIWHGLLNKPGEKIISISFKKVGDNYLYCEIEDNGIGRRKANPGTAKKSLATLFVQQRLDLFNRIYGLACSLVIEDKPGGQGTIVKLTLPAFLTSNYA